MPQLKNTGDFTLVEELWFGDARVDEEAEQTAAKSMVAMSAKMVGLCPFPAVAHKILTLSRDPNFNINELSALIEDDLSFTTRTLRMVNTAAYARSVGCTSIRQAVTLIGSKTIGEMASAWAALDLFPDNNAEMTRLKEHATGTAMMALQLANRLGISTDDIYICCLMHDLGKFFLLQFGEDDYPPLIQESLGDPEAIHMTERERYGYDHAVLGAHVLTAWNIPDPVPKVVAWHHQSARALEEGGGIARAISLVRIAQMLMYAMISNEDKEKVIWRVARDASASFLELTEEKLARWWLDLALVIEQGQQPAEESAEPKTASAGSGLCHICQSASVLTCDTCGEPFCLEHSDSDTSCCSACIEDDLSVLETPTRDNAIWIGMAVVLGLIIVTMFLTVMLC